MSGRTKAVEPCRLGDAIGDFVQRLAPVHARCDSLLEAWQNVLPEPLRRHCRIDGVSGGCLKVAVDAASYMYELQLCKAELLAELQRLCPGAALRRITIAMAPGGR
ncbi:DUF721 domain-containing protein [Anaerobaca lacustris]|uniref:DUF721 domain-containing protein n=1 Tax=Anaerobaca lacustris TaxID=3044600 RepID=A0AAW6TTM3_9BACT|nr:DUF721 domain-containing protein [Sedimentisphaerales bacterium M17dextr]